ncbi:choice-of-anchor I family protein [Planctomicrobium sp. SH668]|uniref:choice-of-anchor I family protein n=1 Tax=Planctomicrobium sp. SH668 TaxID=3448126 RepID=UPI003F5C90E7
MNTPKPNKLFSGRTLFVALAVFTSLAALQTASADHPNQTRSGQSNFELVPISVYEHGPNSGAEISAFDSQSKHLFTVNGVANSLDIVDLSHPHSPRIVKSVDLSAEGRPTSVNIKNGMIAVSVMKLEKGVQGNVLFFDAAGVSFNRVQVGFEPDMLTFSPNGKSLLVANEGEPSSDYSIDPIGSISIIDVSRGLRNVTQSDVTDVGFEQFNSQREALSQTIRIFAKAETVAQDIEPEYITVSPDSKTAWVTCQEANAIAILDIESKQITHLQGLGFKDHRLPHNAIDVSDEDGGINIRNWPIHGMYQPDGIANFQVGGQTYLITANEGELRNFEALPEEIRVADLQLNRNAFPDAETLQLPENLGRLKVSAAFGDHDGDGQFEELFVPGGRSFTIWTDDARLIYDSGDEFERLTAEKHPLFFNSNYPGIGLDARSPAKGCEPESVAIGLIDECPYAFIAMERMGSVLMYNLRDPRAPVLEDYINTSNFEGTPSDIGPEGVLFIAATDSPNGQPLLVVTFEMSGTNRIFEVRKR